MSGERDDDAIENAVAVDGGDSSARGRPSGKRSSGLSERRANRADAGTATLTRSRPSPAGTQKSTDTGRAKNPVARVITFIREVITELGKVIWPSRKQMVTYTVVVLVFVAFMVAYVGGLDFAFVKGVTWLFTGK